MAVGISTDWFHAQSAFRRVVNDEVVLLRCAYITRGRALLQAQMRANPIPNPSKQGIGSHRDLFASVSARGDLGRRRQAMLALSAADGPQCTGGHSVPKTESNREMHQIPLLSANMELTALTCGRSPFQIRLDSAWEIETICRSPRGSLDRKASSTLEEIALSTTIGLSRRWNVAEFDADRSTHTE